MPINYPSDGEMAFMSKLVYLEEADQDAETPFENQAIVESEKNGLQEWFTHWKKNGWQFLVDEFGFMKHKKNGFVGCAYANHNSRQIVIAFRGTKFDSFGPVIEDFQGILRNKVGDQQESAIKFYRDVLNRVVGNWSKISGSLVDYQLSFTGHSLGAWLAEICAADAMVTYQLKLHTVTFDSPGSRSSIETHLGRELPEKVVPLLNSLDITNYLAPPNFINICNPHVGTMIQIMVPDAPSDWITYTATMHDLTNMLFSFDLVTGTLPAELVRHVRDWPHWNLLSTSSAEYKIYHKLKSGNMQMPLTEEQAFKLSFDQQYRAHHVITAFNDKIYPMRNVHPSVFRFLVKAEGLKYKVIDHFFPADAPLAAAFASYSTGLVEGTSELLLRLPVDATVSARDFTQLLMDFMAQDNNETVLFELLIRETETYASTTANSQQLPPVIMSLMESNITLTDVNIADNHNVFLRLKGEATKEKLELIDKHMNREFHMTMIPAGAKITGGTISGNSNVGLEL